MKRIAAGLCGAALAMSVAAPADAHTVACIAYPYKPTKIQDTPDKIVYGVKYECLPGAPDWLYVEAQGRRWPPPSGPWKDYGTKATWWCGYGGRAACKWSFTVFDWTYCVKGTHYLATEGYLEGFHHHWQDDGPKQSYPSATIYCDGTREAPPTPEERVVIAEYRQWVRAGNEDPKWRGVTPPAPPARR